MKRNKRGQFRSYITRQQWECFFIGVVSLWSVFWIGLLVGYFLFKPKVEFVSPLPSDTSVNQSFIDSAIDKGWLKQE